MKGSMGCGNTIIIVSVTVKIMVCNSDGMVRKNVAPDTAYSLNRRFFSMQRKFI